MLMWRLYSREATYRFMDFCIGGGISRGLHRLYNVSLLLWVELVTYLTQSNISNIFTLQKEWELFKDTMN